MLRRLENVSASGEDAKDVTDNSPPQVHEVPHQAVYDVGAHAGGIGLAPSAYITDVDNRSWPFVASLEVSVQHGEDDVDSILADGAGTSLISISQPNASFLRFHGLASLHDYTRLLRTVRFRTQRDYLLSSRAIVIKASDGHGGQSETSMVVHLHGGFTRADCCHVQLVAGATNSKQPGQNDSKQLVYIAGRSSPLPMLAGVALDIDAASRARKICAAEVCMMASAVVRLLNMQDHDRMEVGGAAAALAADGNVSSIFYPSSGELVLNGTADLSVYQSLLRRVVFRSSAPSASLMSDTPRLLDVTFPSSTSTRDYNTSIAVVQPVHITSISPTGQISLFPSENFSVTVNATGTPTSGKSLYHWEKYRLDSDGRLQLDKWPDGVPHDGAVLTIRHLLFGSDEGHYRCRVSNLAGEELLAFTELRIQTASPTWRSKISGRQLISPRIIAQQKATILVGWDKPADNGYAVSNFVLYYREEGSIVWKIAKDYITGTTSIELVKGVDIGLEGSSGATWEFRVEARNGYSSRVGRINDDDAPVSDCVSGTLAGVTAQPREPRFTVNLPRAATPLPNTNLRLSVVVDSNPLPAFQWYRNGVAIHNGTDVELMGNSVTLKHVTPSVHNGVYFVVASMYLGKVKSSSVEISVSEAPTRADLQQLVPLPGTDPAAGTQVILQCSSDGNPEPSFSWVKSNNSGDLSLD